MCHTDRSDVEPSAQTAAAAALSLLAARDLVVQDSVRYLGGLTHLIDLLASTDAFVSETARYTLLALRHGNVKNQAEVRCSHTHTHTHKHTHTRARARTQMPMQ